MGKVFQVKSYDKLELYFGTLFLETLINLGVFLVLRQVLMQPGLG